MSEKPVADLVRKARSEGVEPCLWYGRLMWRRGMKASAGLRAELLRRSSELRAFVVEEFASVRARSGGSHKWVIRLGDHSSKERCVPAMLACGPSDWSARMIRQAQDFAQSDAEKHRWLILESDQVGAPMRNDRDVLVASFVKLPDGLELGGPKDSHAEIVSACGACLSPPVDDATIKSALTKDSD